VSNANICFQEQISLRPDFVKIWSHTQHPQKVQFKFNKKKVSQNVDFEGGKEDRSIQTDENHLKGRFLPFVQHEKYG